MSSPKYTDFNQKQYHENVDRYIENNNDGYVGGLTPEERVNFLSTVLPTGRRVFEIGSGPGYDATALKDAGYDVTPSDYVEAFVQVLLQKKFKVIKFNAKADYLSNDYDAIYANAVFVHFSAEEIKDFLLRVKDHLKNEKVIFISVIKGEGSERSGRISGIERDFHYHTLEEIAQLANMAGYAVIDSKNIDQKWLQILLQA